MDLSKYPSLYSQYAEQSALGGILNTGETEDLERVTPKAFYEKRHQLIAQAILAVAGRGITPDLVTTMDELVKQGNNESAGGASYLSDLQRSVPTRSNIPHYLDQVAERAINRNALVEIQSEQEKLLNGSGSGKRLNSAVFKLVPGFDGFDMEFSYLIKGYLPAHALGVVYGASGSFKSFHALSWAAHVALGRSWNGARVNPASVLYIAGEGGIGVPRRIKALANEYNHGHPIPNLYRLDFPVQFGDTDQVNQLVTTIKQQGTAFGLVIVDTLARCFGCGDENMVADMGRFIAACDRLKAEVGATVLVVHHSGVQDKDRARGSSALRGACDFEYRVERVQAGGPALTLVSTKAKDEREQPKQMYMLKENHLFTDNDGDPVVSLVCTDTGLEPPEEEQMPETTRPLTQHEQTVYQAIRCRQAQGDSTEWGIVRDDMKAQGHNVKNFDRWVKGCEKKGVIRLDGKTLITTVFEQ